MATRYNKWRAACAHIDTIDNRAQEMRDAGLAERARLILDASRLEDEGLRDLAMAEAVRRGDRAVQSANTKADGMRVKELKEIRALQPPPMTNKSVGVQVLINETTGDLEINQINRDGRIEMDIVLTPAQLLAVHDWVVANMTEVVPTAEEVLQGRN